MTHRIAVMPGDGIGKEVMPEGCACSKPRRRKFGIELAFTHFDWSCDYYAKHGRMMPEDWFEQLRAFEAIFFGAVGWPATVPDHVSLWGSLIQFRRGFDQYVNLRPCRLMPGIPTPLANRKPGDIDFVVVRENTEGEYSSVGGRMFEGTEREIVFQESVFSRKGVDRILKFAFELARTRPREARDVGDQVERHLDHDAVLGRALSRDGGALSRHHAPTSIHIDILSAHFVQRPERFDVVVGSNLFGDILSDLGPAVCGTIGIAPSANINPGARVSVAVRAGARLGARHRRQGHRQSDRADLVGRADARVPRSHRRRAQRSSRRSSACSPIQGAAHAGPRRQGHDLGTGKRDRRGDLSRLRVRCRGSWHDSAATLVR